MNVNQDLINNFYKDIWETLTLDGVPIPYLIELYTPLEYRPNEEEMNIVWKRISNRSKENLFNAYMERRVFERDLLDGVKNEKKMINLIEDYFEKELFDFIESYPQYSDILE